MRITGNDAFPGFTAPKLLWVREHEPEIYRRVRQVLLPKDYVRFRLTGDYATDRAGAGGTLLLDLASRDWSSAAARWRSRSRRSGCRRPTREPRSPAC